MLGLLEPRPYDVVMMTLFSVMGRGVGKAGKMERAERRQALEVLLHANVMLLLILFWAALAGSVLSSLVYDIGHWVHAW